MNAGNRVIPVTLSALAVAIGQFILAPSSALAAGRDPQVFLDGVTGKNIASHLDQRDRLAALRIFSQGLSGPIGHQYAWRNPQTGNSGTFRVSWEFREGQFLCRDFTEETRVKSRRYVGQGTACKQADGNWHLR